jgi:transketolase
VESTDAWLDAISQLAHGIRRRTLEATIAKNGGYLCQACSSAEILAVLHRGVLRDGDDLFVLSPAHYSLPLYAALAEMGKLDPAVLATYGTDGSSLEMIGSEEAPGMVVTGGSLGQALSQAIGMALARRLRSRPGRVFVFVSDGELEEGQTWEALMSAAHYGLHELIVIVDANDSQVDGSPAGIMSVEPIVGRLEAFGFECQEIDGHDPIALRTAFEEPHPAKPSAVVCRTRVWEGIPSLEGRANQHYVRFRPGEADAARADLEQSRQGVSR